MVGEESASRVMNGAGRGRGDGWRGVAWAGRKPSAFLEIFRKGAPDGLGLPSGRTNPVFPPFSSIAGRSAGNRRCSSIRLQRRQLVAVRIAKVKAPSAGEAEDRFGDGPSGGRHRDQRLDRKSTR